MKKHIALFGMSILLLAACGREPSPENGSPSFPEENTTRLQEEAARALNSQEASEADFAPRGFVTSEGIPSHKFSGMETVDFKSKVTFEGEYLLLFTATGDERAQIQVSSPALGFANQPVPITSQDGCGFWTTASLSPGEYTFTAESLGGESCGLIAFICPLQRLESLPESLSGELPAAYVCTFLEDTAINYTFYDQRDIQRTYGPMAEFYLAGDGLWQETLYMESNAQEATGSASVPPGDLILYFHTSNWRIDFAS